MADSAAGYERGPDATVRACAAAWRRVGRARAIVLVEGVSDQIAVESAAAVLGRDLDADGVVVLPIGGAQAIGRTLRDLRAGRRADHVVAGLYDAGEELFFRRALADHGLGEPNDRAGLARIGFHACVDDLEDELLRAAGIDLVDHVLAEQGDRASFATLQAQRRWRGTPFEARFRRFVGAGAGRKHRYAAALVRAIGPDRLPPPLTRVIAHATGESTPGDLE